MPPSRPFLSVLVISICFNLDGHGKYFRLTCSKLNKTIISLEYSFYLSLYTALVHREEEKCYKPFQTFKLSLAPLNLVSHVKRSDFKISKQISLVMF